MKRSSDDANGTAAFSQAEARELWATLTRAVPATTDAVRRWPPQAVTVKLDGRRAALVRRDGELWRVTQLGAERLSPSPAGPDFVADAEELDGVFHVFDALVAGRDVRVLALPHRLAAVAPLLPTPLARLKSYHVLRTTADLARAAALSRASANADGLVLVSLDAPYERPPLKFKERVTCDLTLEEVERGRGTARYRVLARSERRLLALRWPLPPVLQLSPQELSLVDAPAPIRRDDGIVVECELRDGRWLLLRRRRDRAHPNDLRTVQSNAALAAAGMHTAHWLLGAVPGMDSRAAVRCWLAALRREVTADALDRMRGDELRVVELGDVTSCADLYEAWRWRAASPDTAAVHDDAELWVAFCCLTPAQLPRVLASRWRRLLLAIWSLPPATARRLEQPAAWLESAEELQGLLRATGASVVARRCTPPPLLQLPGFAQLQATVGVYELSRSKAVLRRE